VRIAKAGMIGFVDEVLVETSTSVGGISSSVANYCDARCRMIVKYIDDISENGLLDFVISDLFRKAEKNRVLEETKKLLWLYLERKGIMLE
jgi:hypothetical protein